jgi:hypothetical protein
MTTTSEEITESKLSLSVYLPDSSAEAICESERSTMVEFLARSFLISLVSRSMPTTSWPAPTNEMDSGNPTYPWPTTETFICLALLESDPDATL